MSKKTVRIIAFGAIGLVFGYLILSKAGLLQTEAQDGPSDAAQAFSGPPPVMPVNAVVVKPSTLKEVLSVSGTIYPDEEVAVASEVSGKVTRIYFREGAPVGKGKLLVKIDDAELRASLKKVSYQIELARQQETRKKKLLEIGGISQDEYDEALTALNTLEAEEQLIKVQIAKTEIKAPFSGIIGIRELSEGSYVTPGTRIANLVKTNPVKIEFSIPEKYTNRVKVGANINFSLEGVETVYDGKVYARNASIDMETRTLLIKAKSSNPGGTLVPGAFANVDIYLAEYDDALMVPTQAIVPEQQGQKVFVIKQGKAQPQAVTVGIRQAEKIQIVEGVAQGDSVLISGLMQIRPGSAVAVKELN